jgi:DNA-binding transcriptional ArsR family regulator
MESTFATLAEPSRLAIVGLLLERERSVQEIEAALHLPQPTISKHLRILRERGLVECRPDAQRRFYQLRAEPFQAIDRWLAPYREQWRHSLSALERHLDRKAAARKGARR